MKRNLIKVTSFVIAIFMLGTNIYASFISDSPVYTGVQSEVSLKWGERGTIVNNFLPGKVHFTLNVDLRRAMSITEYDVYAGIDGGEKKLIKKLLVVPGSEYSYDISIPGVKNGKCVIEIEVQADGKTVFTTKEEVIVMEGYSKQFMDEFTIAGICYNYTNNHTVFLGENTDYDRFKFAGFNSERSGFLWQLHEKQKGVYDYSWVSYPEWDKALKRDGIASIQIAGGGNPYLYPMWEEHLGMDLSTLDPSIQSIRHRYAPHTQEGIYAYVNAFMNLDKNFGDDDTTYEIWNEPNVAGFWQPQPHLQDYGNLVKAFVTSFRANGNDNHFATLSIASTNMDNPIEYFEQGIYPYMTDMSYHNYTTHNGIDDNRMYETQLDRYHKIIVEAGGWKRQSLTENGWPTGTLFAAGVSPEFAAENAAKMYTICDSKNTIYHMYSFVDAGRDPSYLEHNWGIVTKDGVPKLGYIALTNRNIQLRGGVFVGELDLGDSEIRAFVYLKENKPVVQIWDGSKSRDEHNITFEGEHLRVNDFYGTLLSEDTDTLTLTKYPSYINGLSHKYVAMAALADLKRDKDLYLSKYTDVLPSKHITALTTAFDNAITALANPTAENIKNSIDEFDKVGVAIIESAEKGEVEEIVASRATFELMEAVSTLCVVYMSEYDGDAFEEAPYSVDASKAKAEALYRNDIRTMPYSDAILSYAIDTDKKVKGLLASDYDPESIKGYVAGWAMETKVYSDWFEAFSEFEEIIDYGMLAQIMPSSRETFAGDELVIKINANNHERIPFEGTIRVYDEDGKEVASSENFTLAEKEYKYIEIPYIAEKRGESKERKFTVSYVNKEGKILNSQPLAITIKDKLSAFVEPCTTTVDKMKAVKLKFTNLTNDALRFNLNVKSDENYTFATDNMEVSMDANETRIVEIPITEIKSTPFHFYTVEYEAVDMNGTVMGQGNVPLNFTAVVKAKEPMNPQTFGGDVSAWSDAYPIYINAPENPQDAKAWASSENASRVFLKWDENNLYLLADIYDDAFLNINTGASMWNGDCLQISVDSQHTKSEKYDGDDYEFGFALTEKGMEVYTWQSPITNKTGVVDYLNVIRDNDRMVTRYLFAIPKSEIPTLNFAEGTVFGFNLVSNDADVLDRENLYEFTEGTGFGKTPYKYADFIFAGSTNEVYTGVTEEIFPSQIEKSENASALS